ncbi:MAG: tRNA pseudouridine(55) synthase TruB [Hydrogenophilaceae bacterium]|nr:tRNA pseudouridine(55) synthase TruB [Hydrogenophilaceae bacterium]
MAKRKINGVLLLDKPTGLTSNSALQRAKRLYEAEKAGHTGTLDPFASGLLPICLGEATKFSQFLLNADKTYRAEIRLGVRTSTADPEGEVIETRPVAVGADQVRAVLPRFLGEIMQIPPMHSALKRDGRPLYEYARQGIEIERAPRPVQVHELTFESLAGEVLTLLVHCGKGLYVRTLAEDIGAALGCGAYLQALRRLQVGPFRLEDAVGLPELEALDLAGRDARLKPEFILVADLPRLELDIDAAWQVCHGQAIWRPGLVVGQRFALYGPEGRFLGVAEVDEDGKVAPRRLLAS